MGEKGNNEEMTISSVEIINKYGLSRATLNNYIRLKILPRPLVKKPEDPAISRARQMGYFPPSALITLERVIQYKKEGRRMAEICRLLAGASTGSLEEGRNSGQAYDTREALTQRRVSGCGNENEELFPFDDTAAAHLSADPLIKRDARVLLKQGSLCLVHFSVLVAEIQNSKKICAEMPPHRYIDLMRQIVKSVSLSLNKYFGIYGKHPGNGMVFYFIKDRDSSYLMNAVVAALELRQIMNRMNQRRKVDSKYVDDLYLNIGINEGHEYMAAIPAASTVEYIALGDSFDRACRLSDLARSGSIWTTKNLLNRLDEKNRRQIRYGIYRREENRTVWVENIFSRVMDLIPHEDPEFRKYMDIWTLPVTEIQDPPLGIL